MPELPYMPWYPAEYLADTAHLTEDEDLAYRRMLDYAWLNNGLPPDVEEIRLRIRLSGDADACRSRVQKLVDAYWVDVTVTLFDQYGNCTGSEVRWKNPRQEDERSRILGRRKKSAESSRRYRRTRSSSKSDATSGRTRDGHPSRSALNLNLSSDEEETSWDSGGEMRVTGFEVARRDVGGSFKAALAEESKKRSDSTESDERPHVRRKGRTREAET